LFLYTELADYTVACLRALKSTEGVKSITVVHYPVNPEAPFKFDFGDIGEFINLGSFKGYGEFKKKIDTIRPHKIVVSGWVNRWYLRICGLYCRRVDCILTMDNHWKGTTKQRIFCLGSWLVLPRIFTKVWVPGLPQVSYAKKLGFNQSNILQGFYCCDTDFYLSLGQDTLRSKAAQFPKRILCVARYVPQKNYNLLWDAFKKWKSETNNEWELWCAGTGEEFENRMLHPAIRHLGFIQKQDWGVIIEQTGIFILPSIFEPWGVSVHEFAALGYPLILSRQVGAGSAFLGPENGFFFDPDDTEKLIDIFTRIGSLSAEQLLSMGKVSRQLAGRITTEGWARTLLNA